MIVDPIDEVLRSTGLFSQLDTEERAELLAIGRVVRARAGATLIRQGDDAGGMSVVLSGQVRVDLELPDGRRQTLATLGRGDVFGELSLLDRFPRSASAIAATDAQVFLINGTEFDRLRQSFRPAAYKILRAVGPVLCRRLRTMHRAIAGRLMEQRDGVAPEAEGEAAGAVEAGAWSGLPFGSLPSLLGSPTPMPVSPDEEIEVVQLPPPPPPEAFEETGPRLVDEGEGELEVEVVETEKP